MNIDSVNNFNPVSIPQAGPRNVAQQPAQVAEKETDFAKTTELQRQQEMVSKLKEMEEVRADKVAEGKRLANDPNFPNKQEMSELAKALLSPIS